MAKRRGTPIVPTSKIQDTLSTRLERCQAALQDGAREFLRLDGVIGVGWAPKQRGSMVAWDEPAVVVYVEEKKPPTELPSDQLIPPEVDGVPTDVVVPAHRPGRVLTDHDYSWVDWAKVHDANPDRDVGLEPAADFDLDDVAVLQIDDTFVVNGKIDWPKATQRFLASHDDVFDFVTFYIDTATGLPGQGSFHSGIYNTTTGINYYAGANLNNRAAFGTSKLLAFLSIGWIGNQVLLQEFGHMWGAYVRNRDTQGGANRYDLLISNSGQGMFHWGRFFDNDHSPMDYDGIDWQALAGGQFSAHGIADDFYHYFPLDLYLMGLIPAPSVGSFYVIQNPSGNSGTITGTAKTIAVDNVIWAEGPRNPAWPNTQTVFKQAFVVLTKDTRASSTFINQVAAQRRAFTWQFYKATGFLGRVDTTLRGFVLLPRLQGISVAVDDDRAMVGWRTFPATTRGRVNYALTPTAFRRDQAHTEPFSTVTEAVAGTSHGVQLAGLAANTPYYVEVVAETAEGLVVRAQSVLYTRKQTDGCAPDINNVSVGFVRDKTDAVVAGWHTDEPSDSRVRYGTSTPPGLQSYDAYPTTSHSIALTGLAAGTYFLSVESRDAAGNLTVDNNGGNYYQVTVPTPAAPGFAASNADEISARAAQINEAVAAGDTARAVLQTSELILDVAQAELRHIVETADLPGDPLEAGCQALQVLADRAGSTVSVVARGDGYADLAADPDPLYRLCLRLPADTAAQEAGYPVLSRVVAEVNPSLTIEPRPDLGPGRYRLRYTGS